MQKTNFNIEKPGKWQNIFLWGTIFISAATIKTWLAFKGFALFGGAVFPVMALLHKLTEISGLITVWYGSDKLVRYLGYRKWFVWISGFSFIVFVVHAPLIALVIDKALACFRYFNCSRLLTFIFLAPAMILCCVAFGFIIKKIWPAGYSVLTGGRGI